MRLLSLIASLVACSFATQLATDVTRESFVEPRLEEAEAHVAPHFMCTADEDCEVRNVGNCCGYYPMCANKEAALPDPCPDGGIGVCGFPVIDGCRCGKAGGCVSYQGGLIVEGHDHA